ncbi:MAG: PAS domain-containing protein [Hydrogenovibrio sp.]
MNTPPITDYAIQFERLATLNKVAHLVCQKQTPYRVEHYSSALPKLLPGIDPQAQFHLLDWVHPDDCEAYQRELDAYAKQPEIQTFERAPFRIINPNGEVKWVREMLLFGDIDGEPKLFISWKDITKHYLEDRQNREKEHQLNLVLNSLNIGFFEFLLGTQTVFYSASWKKQLGYEAYEIEDTISEWEKRVPPKYIATAYRNLEKHLSGEAEWYETVFPMRHKHGDQVWILAKGQVERDAAGHPYKVVGTHTDLSAVQKLPQQLRTMADMELFTETLYQRLFAAAPLPLMLFNLTSHQVEVNAQMVALTGYQSHELNGQVFTRLCHSDDRTAALEYLERQKHQSHPQLKAQTRRIHHKDGDLLTVTIHSFVTTLENGEPLLCAFFQKQTEPATD